MPKIFKYAVLLILLFWLIGMLTLKTGGIIHLFLAIGVYGAILAYTSERKWKKLLVEGNESTTGISMVPSKLSQLDQPIQQGMPWLSDYVLVSTAPNTGRQMQQATENQDWSATNLRSSTQGDSGKSASAAGASFSRSESLMLCLLHCCLGSLLRNSKNATYQYYGFLLHSYWMGQSRASKLASIDASSTEPLHLTANASIKSLQNTPTSGGTARAWQQIRQQITGPRMIMMRNGCNVVLYRALLPSAATSFVNTSRYFHSVPTQHRFQPSCSPSEDIHPTSAKQPLFVAVKARKYIQGLGIRPQGDPLKAGPQLIKRA